MKHKTRTIDKVFWSAYSRYWDKPERSEVVKQRVEEVINTLTIHGASAPERVLDTGCGTGLYTLALAQAGFRATGVDFAPGVLNTARRRADELKLPAVFEKANLDGHFWYADHYFDHALCISSLHLVGKPEWTLAELHRILRPGGLLIINLWLSQAMFWEHHPLPPAPPGEGGPGMVARARQTARNLAERSNRARFWTAAQIQKILESQDFEVLQNGGSPVLMVVVRRK